MSDLIHKFWRGVDGWEGYAPTDDARSNDRIVHSIMSRVAAVLPEPLAVTGAVEGRESTQSTVIAVGEDIAVRVTIGGDQPVVDVFPLSSLRYVRIDAAPDTTSGMTRTRDTGFTLVFDWGSAKLGEHHGNRDERAEWLQHYVGLLRQRAVISPPR